MRLDDVHHTIDPVFRDSPQFESGPLSAEAAGTVVIKVETANPVGCFKGRGADYLFHCRSSKFSRGVVAASAGNFGQGLAYTARKYGTGCTIFAPRNANTLKIDKMKALGAEVHLDGADFDEAKDKARLWAQERDARFVEDGREPELSAGAGTIAYELLRETGFDAMLIPLGNGSLLNGMARVAKALSPRTRVIGVCAAGAPAMARSFQQKKFQSTQTVTTIADGIAVRSPVEESLPDLFEFVDDVVLVSDEEIRGAMSLVFRAHRLIVEPAGAAGLAALLAAKDKFRGTRIAIPLCGSNLTDQQIKDWLL